MRHFFIVSACFIISSTIVADERKPSTEEEQIRSLLDDQVVAWNKGDLEGFMKGYWNSEELTFYSGKDVKTGWKSTMQRYKERYQGKGKEMGKLKFSGLEIQSIGPMAAIVKGRWQVELKKEKLEGLFTLLLRKTADGWRIVHDHTS